MAVPAASERSAARHPTGRVHVWKRRTSRGRWIQRVSVSSLVLLHLLSALPCEKDRVMRSPFLQASAHVLDIHIEFSIAQALHEFAIVPGRPDGQDAVFLQCGARTREPGVTVEADIRRGRERGGTVVDVQENGVKFVATGR